MSTPLRNCFLFALVGALIVSVGLTESWNLALYIVNMGLVSAIMAMGVNMQWGFAGLFNIGIMGFVALGGLGTVLVSLPPVGEAWEAGGVRMLGALAVGAIAIVAAVLAWRKLGVGLIRGAFVVAVLILGFILYRTLFDPARDAIEAINPAFAGNLGGINIFANETTDAGWMTILAWHVGALLAAGAAWIVGKTALGLRSDYLAIATLGISEIIIAILKNEDWLARGVKNVIGLPRPVPYEIDLQNDPAFVERVVSFGADPVIASSIAVKLGYTGLFAIVLLIVLWLAQAALNSPWGRMMRAIRDNETAAEAMGKDVTARHLQIFILGSAVCGLAGAMMTTLDGQLTPGSYQPLRFTFLIWVMVIVGGSGNNFGSILGGFLIWYLWVMMEPYGTSLLQFATAGMDDGSPLKMHLLDSAAHMRLLTMGIVLLLVLRFSPRGLIPER